MKKRPRKKSVAVRPSNSGSDDEGDIPPLNFKYVEKRWQKEATHGIDSSILQPIKGLEASAKWLAKIPYQYWCTIFTDERKDPFNVGQNEKGKKDSWNTVVSS